MALCEGREKNETTVNAHSLKHKLHCHLTLMVPELLSSYLHSQRKQYASTSFPFTGMGSTT